MPVEFGRLPTPQEMIAQNAVYAAYARAFGAPTLTSQLGVPPATIRNVGPFGSSGILGELAFAIPRYTLASRENQFASEAYRGIEGATRTVVERFPMPKFPATKAGKAAAKAWNATVGIRLPTSRQIPEVGVNTPLIPGSRADPQGLIRPFFAHGFHSDFRRR